MKSLTFPFPLQNIVIYGVICLVKWYKIKHHLTPRRIVILVDVAQQSLLHYLWSHPVWGSDERISSPDCSIQLSWDAEVDEFHLGVVRQENVLAFDVAMDHFAGVQVSQSTKNLAVIRKMILCDYILLLKSMTNCILKN